MFIFNKSKEFLDSEKYKVYKVNILLTELKNGIQFMSYERLEEFMKDHNIDTVFFTEYFDNYDDYIITEETIRKANIYINSSTLELIQNDIENYNKKIMKIDFDKPSAAVISCIFESKYCFVYLENDKVFGEILVDANEKLKEILEKNINSIEKKAKEDKQKIELLKQEVKDIIVNDKEFLLCTNKQLRKNYARKFLKQKLDKKKFKLLIELWTWDAPIGIGTDAIDFIEMIWKELK